MNNHRLLTGLLVTALLSGGVRAVGQNDRIMTIEQLFEIAETNSAQLRPSFTAEEEAQQEISVARSKRLPDIKASLSFSYIGDGFTTKRDFSDYQRAPIPHFGNGLSLNLNQPVYAGEAISAGIEMAELKSSATGYATEIQRDNIRFQLVGMYLDLYKYENLRKVVSNNIVQAEKVLAEMESRYEQGLALRNDITRYELLVSDLNLQLTRISNTINIINRNLAVTAGLPDNTVIRPDTTILTRSLLVADENWWMQEAAGNAPSLKLALLNVNISQKAETLVKSERLPKIGIQAGWNIDGPILTEIPPINRNLSYWYVGIGVSYNLSSLYKSNKSLAKSRAATRRAIEQLDATNEHVSLDVRADYIHYLEAYDDLNTREKSVELAERNYRTISTRYSEGMALISDMLDAANSRLNAEQQLVNARINIIYYYYKLLFTTGKI